MSTTLYITNVLICMCLTTSAPNTKSGQIQPARTRHLVDLDRVAKAIPYHKIHENMHGEDLKKYKTWSELEAKNPSELIQICEKYFLCLGMKYIADVRNANMDLQMLRYHILNENNPHEGVLIQLTRKVPKSRPVRMLKCIVKGRRTFRFVEGSDEYSAFLVEPTNASKPLYAIVDACQSKELSELHLKIDSNKKRGRKQYFSSRMDIQQAIPYHKLHAEMHGDNLKLYEDWLEMERKTPSELDGYCCEYIKCIGQDDFYVKKGQSVLTLRRLKYYIVEERKYQRIKNIAHRYYYVNRWVKMLECQSIINKSYRFIKGSGQYDVFHVQPTNSKYNLFTIVGACEIDNLYNIEEDREFDLSSIYGNTLTTAEFLELEELTNDMTFDSRTDGTNENNIVGMMESVFMEANNIDDIGYVISTEKNIENDVRNQINVKSNLDKASDEQYNDEQTSAKESSSIKNSEAIIIDDEMYLKNSEPDEYDSEH